MHAVLHALWLYLKYSILLVAIGLAVAGLLWFRAAAASWRRTGHHDADA
jgi:hypothetical protein